MRSTFRNVLPLLSIPALAGLIGVGHAQSLALGESAGQPPDRPAIRQTAMQGVIRATPVSLSAFRQASPAEADAVRGGRLLRMTAPSYPLAAKLASVSGVVTVEALVGLDGRVVQTSVVRGPSPLRRIAEDTVKSWRFEPTLLNGKPVERVAEVDLEFVLGRY
ncbi:MAG TPA: energy transducer TonB [Bryobacteraceae bacterium]|nr:energy transducer TonB [Bryobacteraceae bacterium]